MEQIKRGLIFLFLILIFIPFSTADLTISKPESIYNLGDKFDITIKASPSTDSSGFLTAELNCGGNSIEIYRSPQSINAGEEKVIQISTELGNFLVSGFGGNCHIIASFSGEQSSSKGFELSREITVSLNINGILFNPGDSISIYGRAEKTQGTLNSGSVELEIPDMYSTTTYPIENGEYFINTSIPSDSRAGDYSVVIRIFERDSNGALLNEGSSTSQIKVKQLLKSLEIAPNSQTVTPGNNLTYKALAYDQARDLVIADIPITVSRPDETEFIQKLLRTDETSYLYFEKNAPAGTWIIKATLDGFETTKEIVVEERSELSYTLNEDQTLTLTNIGNVPYNGPVEVSIGGTSKVKDVNILAGGEKTYRLEAPDGEYEIMAGSGEERTELGSTFLTGNAISVEIWITFSSPALID